MNILIINGPNLNMLGKRDHSQYGSLTLDELEKIIKREFPEQTFTFIQSNSESEICSALQNSSNKYNGIILNPGGFTHTSIAIRDAMEICPVSVVEAHLSNISARESFRKTHITTSKATGYISGFKENSYLAAVYILQKIIHSQNSLVVL